MKPQEFQQYWQYQYDKCLPIGYKLRQKFKESWFRIHTLPQSQRYAQVAEEYQEIFRRHNTVITDLGSVQVLTDMVK